ncbi:MAG: tocopherol cyclase family protein [Bacteroidales bacterium]
MLIKSILPRIYRPEVYQGKKKPANYFEGWYMKLVDGAGDQVWAFIPGVSYSADTHCFIQVIHANSGKTWYLRFPVEDFKSSRRIFHTAIGFNHFSSNGLNLDLILPDLKVRGELIFENPQPFPATFLSPGIMGWYSYAPMMECYHGVVSLRHRLSGALEINGAEISFEGGKGYIEKDWGRSMPSDWIWIQSNHFEGDPEASFMLSLARIPWMGGYFPGFLSFFMTGGRLYRFATYNHSSVRRIDVKDDAVHIELQNGTHSLALSVNRKFGGILKAPRHGNMEREIQESIVSSLNLELKDKRGILIFKQKGVHAGLEIVGDVAKYFQNNH